MDQTSISSVKQDVTSLILQQKYSEAISLLKSQSKNPEISELLGLAYFKSEQYSPAADAFSEALKSDPSSIYLAEMLGKCRENSVAEVQVQVPDEYFFEREKLLQPPVVKPPVVQPPMPPDTVKDSVATRDSTSEAEPRTAASRSALSRRGLSPERQQQR